jgi:hypothetical protein
MPTSKNIFAIYFETVFSYRVPWQLCTLYSKTVIVKKVNGERSTMNIEINIPEPKKIQVQEFCQRHTLLVGG